MDTDELAPWERELLDMSTRYVDVVVTFRDGDVFTVNEADTDSINVETRNGQRWLTIETSDPKGIAARFPIEIVAFWNEA